MPNRDELPTQCPCLRTCESQEQEELKERQALHFIELSFLKWTLALFVLLIVLWVLSKPPS